ncbi:MAG: YceD family protein, partial [Candidatus Macondimonas sp.]
GEVGFALAFFRDDQGRSRVTGAIQGSVMLTCQRCLQPVRHELAGSIELMALADESALSELPGDVEPLLTEGQPVRLADLVEDEALLALPIVALHPRCLPPSHDKSGNEDGNPFAVLKRKE